MQRLKKFSILKSIKYAFHTYFKNFSFFGQIISIALFGSVIIYFIQNYYMFSVFSAKYRTMWFVIGLNLWVIPLQILLFKSYDNNTLFNFKDFSIYLNYYDRKSYGSCASHYFFLHLVNLIFHILLDLNLSPIGWMLRGYFCSKYCLNAYLILDKKLTFWQSIKMSPNLIYGKRKKLLFLCLIIFLIQVLTGLFCAYVLPMILEEEQINLFFLIPFWSTILLPIESLTYIYIYKQLITNADENFNIKLYKIMESKKIVIPESM